MPPPVASGVASSRTAAFAPRWTLAQRAWLVVLLACGSAVSASAAAVDWRLLGDWAGGGPHAGFVISFSPDGGYVIAQEGIPAGFGSYAVDGRQILLFPGGTGEFPERGAYGFSGTDRLTIMTQNFGRSEWQRLTPFGAADSGRGFDYGEQNSDDRSSFEKAVEKLEKLSSSLEDVERKLDGESSDKRETATAGQSGKKHSLFERMKDAARKTAGTAGNLGRKAARSVKAAGDAWKDEDRKDRDKSETTTATASDPEAPAPAPADNGAAPAAVNPMLGGAPVPAATETVAPPGGLGGGISATAPAMMAPVFGAASTPVVIDAALAQRASQLASQWKTDASLVEIVAQLGADGSANVAASPQAVALWFASAGAPGEGLKLSLTPDGSFVTAPAPRPVNPGAVAPTMFVASATAVNTARQAGLRGEAFSASLRAVSVSGGGSRFGWIIAPAGSAPGSGEIVIDAVTGQPLR